MKQFLALLMIVLLMSGCAGQGDHSRDKSAAEILGNPDFMAFSYGGYRHLTREQYPSLDELKEDMKILSALGVKIIRTYNVSHFPQARMLLEAIHEMKNEDPDFEMYVMLGAWMDCKGAFTDNRDHNVEDEENNITEIETAVELLNTYPDIVKIIAVGNEAMVHWAVQYYVQPGVILKWVNYLQALKKEGKIPADTWITSSDNFASWGGGDSTYHLEDLTALMKAVDYISMHTYPFHDTHHNPDFWIVPPGEEGGTHEEKIVAGMERACDHAKAQYQAVYDYMSSLGIDKPIHIGETGWASVCGSLFGSEGSGAADEFKQKLFYEHMREWTREQGMSCFYFEVFDEPWKDAGDPLGSENHFGLFTINSEAKFALWSLVDEGVFDGLTRNGLPITKSKRGDKTELLSEVKAPPTEGEVGIFKTPWENEKRNPGEKVTELTYVLVHEKLKADESKSITWPSSALRLNAWEGSCGIEMSSEGIIDINTGKGEWWGCALQMESDGPGEDLSAFNNATLHFEMKGFTECDFMLGFQSGLFPRGDQVNNAVEFGPGKAYSISENWSSYAIPVSEMDKGANFKDVTSIIYLRGDQNNDGKHLYLKNIYYKK